MRLTFHPEYEIPQMRQWYKRYKNPSEAKLNFFAMELNKGHVRQERPKVTVGKLKNWWKNERQKEKRISIKEEGNEKEKKEIEKLKVEAAKSSARQRFIDQDHLQVKVAKVVPSPQKSPESKLEQLDTSFSVNRSPQQTSGQQSVMMSPLSHTVSSGSQRTPTGISYPIISVVDRQTTTPSHTPSGFVSLLQQTPVEQNRSPGQRLAESSPGPRIGQMEFGGRGGSDRPEMRTFDFAAGQLRAVTPVGHGHARELVTRNVFGEGSGESNSGLRGSDGRSPEARITAFSSVSPGTSQESPPTRYDVWNYKI